MDVSSTVRFVRRWRLDTVLGPEGLYTPSAIAAYARPASAICTQTAGSGEPSQRSEPLRFRSRIARGLGVRFRPDGSNASVDSDRARKDGGMRNANVTECSPTRPAPSMDPGGRCSGAARNESVRVRTDRTDDLEACGSNHLMVCLDVGERPSEPRFAHAVDPRDTGRRGCAIVSVRSIVSDDRNGRPCRRSAWPRARAAGRAGGAAGCRTPRRRRCRCSAGSRS